MHKNKLDTVKSRSVDFIGRKLHYKEFEFDNAYLVFVKSFDEHLSFDSLIQKSDYHYTAFKVPIETDENRGTVGIRDFHKKLRIIGNLVYGKHLPSEKFIKSFRYKTCINLN